MDYDNILKKNLVSEPAWSSDQTQSGEYTDRSYVQKSPTVYTISTLIAGYLFTGGQ